MVVGSSDAPGIPVNQPFLFLLISLASYRLWRIPGRDTWPPAEAFRGWLERRTGKDSAWTDFVTCPFCAGFWITGMVVLVVAQVASVPLPVLQWFAAAAVVGLIGKRLD